ncbi:class E sortase, partial [Corynebacterium propinquum]
MKCDPFSLRRLLGETLLTAGLLIVLFVFYEAFWTNVKSGQLQAQANERMEQRWQDADAGGTGEGVPEPDSGQAFSRIYIPRLGADYEYAVLAGTSQDVLAAGPGHYVETQGPGEIGNFAIAGHRIGQGAPFVHLEDLHTCDAIVVETATQW